MKQKYSYKIISRKPQEVFKLEEIKNYTRITGDSDDELLKEMIEFAIETAENYIKYNITEKIVEVTSYAADYIRLPLVPIAKILEVKADGKTLADFNITDVGLELPAKYKEIIVTYIAGIEDFIPAAIKQAIMLHVAQVYDNRGNINIFGSQIHEIYKPYRKMII